MFRQKAACTDTKSGMYTHIAAPVPVRAMPKRRQYALLSARNRSSTLGPYKHLPVGLALRTVCAKVFGRRPATRGEAATGPTGRRSKTPQRRKPREEAGGQAASSQPMGI